MLPAPKVLEGAAPLPTARGRWRSLLLPPNTCFAAPKVSFHPALFGHGCALSAAAGCSNGTAAVMCGRCPHRSELGAGCWLFPSPVLFKPTCGLEKKAWWLVLVPTSCRDSRQQRSECMATSSARHTVRQLQQKQQQQHCQPQSNHLPLHHQPAQSSLSLNTNQEPEP